MFKFVLNFIYEIMQNIITHIQISQYKTETYQRYKKKERKKIIVEEANVLRIWLNSQQAKSIYESQCVKIYLNSQGAGSVMKNQYTKNIVVNKLKAFMKSQYAEI